MAYTVPTGQIWLLKNIPWSHNYQHTKLFTDPTVQHNWICDNSRLIGAVRSAQNMVKDPIHGEIRIEAKHENYLACNYICWKNTSFDGGLPSSHTYNYAFVNDVTFVSKNVISLSYEIDVIQTYLFQGGCSLKECYIERTHTQTDGIGDHIEPEPIKPGNMVLKNHKVGMSATLASWKVLVYTTISVADAFQCEMGLFVDDNFEGYVSLGMGTRAGMPQGLYCNVFDDMNVLPKFIRALYYGLIDENIDPTDVPKRCKERAMAFMNSIVCIVAVPNDLGITYADLAGTTVTIGGTQYTVDSDLHCGEIATNSGHGKHWYLPKSDYLSDIDGMTPKNNKLFTAPYNSIHITDGDAGQQDYPVELMSIVSHEEVDTFHFYIEMAVQPNPEIICVPYGFPKQPIGNKGIEYRVTINNLPQFGWVTDTYLQWLAQSRTSTVINAITSGMKVAAGAFITGATLGMSAPVIGASAVLGAGQVGLSTGAKLTDEEANAWQSPDSSHISSAQALAVMGEKTYHAYQKCINITDAKRIDNFFTAYGYAVNTIGQPMFTNPRFNQHYIKTGNCCVRGGAPASVIKTIESIFDKGITIWNGEVGDYTDMWNNIT